MNTKQNERLDFSGEKFLLPEVKGAGAGLSSVGAALTAAGAGALVLPDVEAVTVEARPVRAAGVEAMTIRQALSSVERAAGPLLRACQGHADFKLASDSARKLAGRMRAAGATVTPASVEDATGAGAVALQIWRTTGAGVDGAGESLAARVAWRAAVWCMAKDNLGESTISVETVSDSDLWVWAEMSRESRSERAARYRVERAARGGVLSQPVRVCVRKVNSTGALVGVESVEFPAGQKIPSRQLQLTKRMARLPVGRGRRAAVIERVTNCCALLLDGFRLDDSAAAAGFNPSGQGRGRQTAADMFCRAVRRLGFKGWQLLARQIDGERAARRAATPGGGLFEGELVGAEFVPFVPRESVEAVPLAVASDWIAPPVELPARGVPDFTSPDFIGALPFTLASERLAAWRGWLAARRFNHRNGRALARARARALAEFKAGKRAFIRRAVAAGVASRFAGNGWNTGAAGVEALRAIRRAQRDLILPALPE